MTAHHLDAARVEIWWSALAAGLVVMACVVILLSLLTAFVQDIERHLRAASREARGIAEDIQDSDLIGESARLIYELGTELELQLAVLARMGDEAS
jgi:hypothetical protein